MSDAGLYDLVIIGGGINGVGIARDAAGRGYSVLLAEQGDLAGGTSSASTKLIHGGLRYLEHYEFGLVREALKEREVLWRIAPQIVKPMRFVLPHQKGLRPAWLLRLGLFLYDHIGGRKLLPATRTLDLAADPLGTVLKPGLRRAFEYSDCFVDDARLVVLNAIDAAARGATILTRTAVTGLTREGGEWRIVLSGGPGEARARMAINAAGPWVDHVLGDIAGERGAHDIRLVQGSHIVVRRLFDDARAFFFQNPDGRLVFVIPYEDDFTLIGTTDRDFQGDPAQAAASAEEVAYLCAAANAYLAREISPSDVVHSFAGVRPLYDDGTSKAQEATRDYVLRVDEPGGGVPLANVFGGKITTYRHLAQEMMELVAGRLGARGGPWTADAPLPGGDFPAGAFDGQVAGLISAHPFLDAGEARRLTRLYGTRAPDAIGHAASRADMGAMVGAGLHAVELAYLHDREWARTADDVLWRRTKLGLRASPADVAAIGAHMAELAAAGRSHRPGAMA